MSRVVFIQLLNMLEPPPRRGWLRRLMGRKGKIQFTVSTLCFWQGEILSRRNCITLYEFGR